ILFASAPPPEGGTPNLDLLHVWFLILNSMCLTNVHVSARATGHALFVRRPRLAGTGESCRSKNRISSDDATVEEKSRRAGSRMGNPCGAKRLVGRLAGGANADAS